MKPTADNIERREQVIASLLWYGTWLASALIGIGMVLAAFGPLASWLPLSDRDVVKAGVAVLILLPVSRVALMLAIFLRERDYLYVIIAALVLAIIAAGASVS